MATVLSFYDVPRLYFVIPSLYPLGVLLDDQRHPALLLALLGGIVAVAATLAGTVEFVRRDI